MKLIGITGWARSGKDTAAKYISKKFHYKWFDFSKNVIAKAIEKEGLKKTKTNYGIMAKKLRTEFGLGILGVRMIELIKNSNSKKIIVTGFRDLDEIKEMKKFQKDFVLIEIKSDNSKRFERKSEKDPQEKNAFFARDEHDKKEFGMAKVIEKADFAVENNSSLNKLHKNLNLLMSRIESNSFKWKKPIIQRKPYKEGT